MKNSILCGLAAIALTLSFLFEKAPVPAQNELNPIQTASLLPDFPVNPALLEAALPPAAATKPAAKDNPSFKDSLFYHYHAQTLGLRLDHTENKHLLETVADWIGTPYRSGSSSKRGTDCSGFVTRVYKEVYGVDLGRSSRSMFHDVKRISKAQAKEGDLVFFRRGPNQPIYHVGIYLKNNKFVHSATSGGVRISSLKEPYYSRNYYAVGRVM
jgi:probable lipoprotein NlpC